jgi:hypothetical protein
MRVLGQNQRSFDEPTWLMSYDVEWMDGFGRADFTTDLAKAMRFDSARELFDVWTTQSKTCPWRPDGKPNKPLTALTIETFKVTS